MLTAREEEVDKVLGLELGADDYITKPFSVRELMARVKANLRRVNTEPAEAVEEDVGSVINAGRIVLNLDRYEVRRDGKIVDLTLREFELLKFWRCSRIRFYPGKCCWKRYGAMNIMAMSVQLT